MKRRGIGGAWSGQYRYRVGAGLSPTPFLATLTDDEGLLDGMIEEPDNNRLFGRNVVYATLTGRRLNGTITFEKTYEDPLPGQRPITYAGVLDQSGERIEGQWYIPGSWSGTFVMTRADVAGELAEDAAEFDRV